MERVLTYARSSPSFCLSSLGALDMSVSSGSHSSGDSREETEGRRWSRSAVPVFGASKVLVTPAVELAVFENGRVDRGRRRLRAQSVDSQPLSGRAPGWGCAAPYPSPTAESASSSCGRENAGSCQQRRPVRTLPSLRPRWPDNLRLRSARHRQPVVLGCCRCCPVVGRWPPPPDSEARSLRSSST